MVHIIFDVNSVNFDHFFDQDGQFGAGYSFFEGAPYQRGYGLHGKGMGNVLAGLWRFISPALRNLGRDAGKEALVAGSRVLSDLSSGTELGESLRENVRAGAKNVLSKQVARYPQTGTGRRKRRAMIGRAFTKDAVNMIPPMEADVVKKPRKRGDIFD